MRSCTVAYFIYLMLAMPVFAGFVDGFEKATLDPFWTTYITSGSITFPSTEEVHGGIQSVQLNSFQDGGQKWIRLSHVFDTPVFGTFSIWFYDTAADVSNSNWGSFFAFSEALPSTWVGLLVRDYDGGMYYASNGQDSSLNTGIKRTQAWHQFEMRVFSESLTLLIDQQSVYTGAGVGRVSSINFGMYSPDWRPAWIMYWDDFAYGNVVPEPCSLALFALGGLVVAGRKRSI